MTDALYEKYKEALRRGHVAALREQLDQALAAYAEAAQIAPERALPHASLGSVLLRLRRPEEALAAYAIALLRSPRDEAAQAGRSEALAALGRAVEAADSLDRLAEQQETDGKPTDALATARRALELAESRTRRRHVESLTAQLGGSLEVAPAGTEVDAPVKMAPPRAAPQVAQATAAQPPAAAPAQPSAALKPTRAWPGEGRSATLAPRLAQAPPAAQPAPPPRPAPAPEPARPAPAPEPVRQESGTTLAAQAEARIDAGDPEAARDRLLAAAAAHRAAGAIDAALDACYLALGLAPADPELHLALAELYLDRGWRGPAADKILLLGRLVDFARDGTIRERVCQLVASRFADDPRLTALCA